MWYMRNDPEALSRGTLVQNTFNSTRDGLEITALVPENS